MQSRMPSPIRALPSAFKPLIAFGAAAQEHGVPDLTVHMVHLRASQINGCSVCVVLHTEDLRKDGDTDERIAAVAAWRDAPYFTGAERAALALTEAVTRLADHPDPVPDDVWAEAAKHYDEQGLAALLVAISAINVWNRLNVATR